MFKERHVLLLKEIKCNKFVFMNNSEGFVLTNKETYRNCYWFLETNIFVWTIKNLSYMNE